MTIALAVDRVAGAGPLRRHASRTHTAARTSGRLLTKAQIGGRLSLVDQRPIVLAAERGLAVHARSGALWIVHHREDTIIGAGERFVAERSGPVVISALEVSEVNIVWPVRDAERLSPGLEPANLAR
ncbi:MAG: hypothetical protein M5U08_21830 [Burkholderiales bacterium]|nr:hypothetical protein [Burkholderiales bacterium]